MPHEIVRVVAEADIDELGHVSNVTYVRWVLEAAVSHTSAAGLTPADYRRRGQSFVVRRHSIDYLRPSLVGDRIAIETRVTVMRAASSERETIVRHAESGLLLAHATSFWAFIDLAPARPARIPPDIRSLFVVELSGLPAPPTAFG